MTLPLHENHVLRFQVWRTRLPSAASSVCSSELVAAFADRDNAQEYADECVAGDFTAADVRDLTVAS